MPQKHTTKAAMPTPFISQPLLDDLVCSATRQHSPDARTRAIGALIEPHLQSMAEAYCACSSTVSGRKAARKFLQCLLEGDK